MPSASDDIPARLAEEIALRGYDDRYIDRNEEREILQIAIQLGVRLEPARAALADVCDRDGYVLESTVVVKVRAQLQEALGRSGQLDEAAFTALSAAARDLLAGKRNDRAAKAMIVQLLEEDGPPPVKVGWLRNWYAAMKRDAGL